jgi:hypothetical protein
VNFLERHNNFEDRILNYEGCGTRHFLKLILIESPRKEKPVIPTGAVRRFFPSFAPAKESHRAVEESLFDLSRKPATFAPQKKRRLIKNQPALTASSRKKL